MRYRTVKARQEDKGRIQRTIAQRHGWRDQFNGLAYEDDLSGPGGIHLELYATESTGRIDIEKAIREARGARDVVSCGVTIVPQEWIDEAIS